MAQQSTFDPRDPSEPRSARLGVRRPVTAIPARFVAERERVLRILERWAETLQAGRSIPSAAR